MYVLVVLIEFNPQQFYNKKKYNNSNATIITMILTGAVALIYLPLVYNSPLETIQ